MTLFRFQIRSWTLRRPMPMRTVSPLKQRHAAKTAVVSFFLTLLVLNITLGVALDTFWRRGRDAEYVAKRQIIQQRTAVAAGRRTVVVLGSSRVANGVRPLAANAATDPLLVNAGLVGSGPLLQLMTLQRLLRDGVRPDEVLVEYWPAFLNARGQYSEYTRIDPHRFFPDDDAFIGSHMPDPDGVRRLMRELRRTPIWSDRLRLMSHVLPTWLPDTQRFDPYWRPLDAGGWLPGHGNDPAEVRNDLLAAAGRHYRGCFADFQIEPKAEDALREIQALGHQHGFRVRLLWLPESSAFRGWYPPAIAELSAGYPKRFAMELIDAREWMNDLDLADGYHLTQDGAAKFTRRLANVLQP